MPRTYSLLHAHIAYFTFALPAKATTSSAACSILHRGPSVATSSGSDPTALDAARDALPTIEAASDTPAFTSAALNSLYESSRHMANSRLRISDAFGQLTSLRVLSTSFIGHEYIGHEYIGSAYPSHIGHEYIVHRSAG